MLMGIASTLIGLLPTYAMIGVTAPILLTTLRFAQGLAIGGQWGGAMLLVTESAPSNKGLLRCVCSSRGAYWRNSCKSCIYSNKRRYLMKLYVMGMENTLLASAILIGISMYIQLTMEDTKAFRELQNHQ